MKYYLKKCGHQELGSVDFNGKPQRGRYLLTSMNENVLNMFPPLSKTQFNDSALPPIIPLYSGKKIYCNYVYHNDKYHGSVAVHPRNEHRIYLNKALEENTCLYQEDDIIIIRSAYYEVQEEENYTYYLDYVRSNGSALYEQLDNVVKNYPIKGGYGIFEGEIPEFEEKVRLLSNPENCQVEIDESVMKQITSSTEAIASLFNASSFRDFVMTGYGNLCAVTGTVIKYGAYMNLEAKTHTS